MNKPVIVTKFPAFFPPVMGFRHDHYYGLRQGTNATTYWVDTTSGNDQWPGIDPEYPKATIGSTISVLRQTNDMGAQIYCTGAFTESPIVGVTAPYNVTLTGLSMPTWTSDDPAQPCLTTRKAGWTIQGFEFNCPALASGIRLEDDDNDISAYKTIIRDNRFDGLWGGLYGIDFVGAPHRVQIIDNWFIEMHQDDDSAYCIMVSDTASGPGSPYQCAIVGNRFSDSDNYVGGLGGIRGFNLTVVKDNIFEEGVLIIPATYLDLRGGSRGYNIVTGNYFGGTYAVANGYFAHPATPDSCWIGNITEATPATVADNGLTVRVPV